MLFRSTNYVADYRREHGKPKIKIGKDYSGRLALVFLHMPAELRRRFRQTPCKLHKPLNVSNHKQGKERGDRSFHREITGDVGCFVGNRCNKSQQGQACSKVEVPEELQAFL